jgi:hypothetical protein
LPVIVFAGAPFTVATYCIGTGDARVHGCQSCRLGGAAGASATCDDSLSEYAPRPWRGAVSVVRFVGR